MTETCIRFGEHGARVMIEEKEIPHYAMHVDPVKKEVSCWIASEAGKVFSVTWLELDAKYQTAGELYLDGRSAIRRRRESHRGEKIILSRGRVSESSLAPFLFSKLVITDDDTYLDISPHSIGEIKLVIDRTSASKKKARMNDIEPLPLEMVHERSKKATAHRVSYGAEISRKRSALCSKSVETLVTFIFKYRPLEMLQANDIVPRNPELLEPQGHTLDTPPIYEMSSGSAEHSKVKMKAESRPETDDLDEESIREKALLAEVERCQAEVDKIRKARGRHSKESERPKKKVKKEDKRFFTPGEIIDLT